MIGISGDGDTASIGTGQFKHAVRRNVPMVYIVENNGVYGLTKGQFSATADLGQRLKYAGINNLPPLDIAMEALVAGATFVARSFAGDPKQVESLLKAAFSHRGIAVLDIISPCVTFNNHDSSTKSYSWGKAQEDPLNELNFIPPEEEITVEPYEDEMEVDMHDGSKIVLKKLEPDYDPTDRMRAFQRLEEARAKQEFITGLIYVNEQERPDLHELLHICAMPLVYLPERSSAPAPRSWPRSSPSSRRADCERTAAHASEGDSPEGITLRRALSSRQRGVAASAPTLASRPPRRPA